MWWRGLARSTGPLAVGWLFGKLVSMSVEEIKQKLAVLPRNDQDDVIAFLFHLRESDGSALQEVQEDWDKEIDRRLQELRSGAAKGVPLEEVKAKIGARFAS